METGAQLEERRDLSPGRDRTVVRAQDLGHALQERALARPVLADEAEGRAFCDVERHVAQGPELLVASPPASHERGLQRLVALVIEAIALRDGVDLDDRVRVHTSSASLRSRRENTQRPSPSNPIAQPNTYRMSAAGGNRRS